MKYEQLLEKLSEAKFYDAVSAKEYLLQGIKDSRVVLCRSKENKYDDDGKLRIMASRGIHDWWTLHGKLDQTEEMMALAMIYCFYSTGMYSADDLMGSLTIDRFGCIGTSMISFEYSEKMTNFAYIYVLNLVKRVILRKGWRI